MMLRRLIPVLLCIVTLATVSCDDNPRSPDKPAKAPISKQKGAVGGQLGAEGGQLGAVGGRTAEKPYLYRDKPRTKKWFAKHYKYFSKRIAFVDGVYVLMDMRSYQNLQDTRTRGVRIQGPVQVLKSSPTAKTAIRKMPPDAKVFQVIDKSTLIMFAGKYGGIRFFLTSINTSGLVDGDRLAQKKLLYIGAQQYTTVLGATKTIQAYKPYRPLSKEQFAKALADGLVLIEYKWIKGHLRRRSIK